MVFILISKTETKDPLVLLGFFFIHCITAIIDLWDILLVSSHLHENPSVSLLKVAEGRFVLHQVGHDHVGVVIMKRKRERLQKKLQLIQLANGGYSASKISPAYPTVQLYTFIKQQRFPHTTAVHCCIGFSCEEVTAYFALYYQRLGQWKHTCSWHLIFRTHKATYTQFRTGIFLSQKKLWSNNRLILQTS